MNSEWDSGSQRGDELGDETTVDLGPAQASGEAAEGAADERGEGASPGLSDTLEANFILIAHPGGKLLGSRFRLPAHTQLDIGRSQYADVSLPDVPSVSRQHARLHHRGNVVELEDLTSTNGTFVNDEPLHGSRRLRSGDRFQVGAVHFKLLHEQDPEHAYHEAIYQLMVRDGLTQAYNKRKFTEELRREFDRARRHRRPLSLILFDIDRFKQVNDSHGHLCGDFVLQRIARLTSEFLRPEQVFARVGGEELAILSPETDVGGALVLAEKLRRRCAEEVFEHTDVSLHITCSFGVAELTAEITDADGLFAAADRAMYRAKEEGRNRVRQHGVVG